MNFNTHSNLVGTHAPFSASQSAWLRYDDAAIKRRLSNLRAAEMGTKFHELAETLIKMGVEQNPNGNHFCHYVNDALGYRMTPEQVLVYSPYIYGTTDAIAYRDNWLRIQDLKMGKSGSIEQLLIYAALFCLEYNIDPERMKSIELAMYKPEGLIEEQPFGVDIREKMDTIQHVNEVAEKES